MNTECLLTKYFENKTGVQIIKPTWVNSDGSYTIWLEKTPYNGWKFWHKFLVRAILSEELPAGVSFKKVTHNGRGVFLTFCEGVV